MVLRFIGVMNAAVWFGAAIFFTLAVVPAFASPEMTRLLGGDLYSGAAANIVASRYWAIFYWCGSIAFFHQLAEWVYLSRPLKSLVTYLLIGVFTIGLAGGLILQPRLNKLYAQKYVPPGSAGPSPEQLAAAKSYSAWKTTTRFLNFLALAGLTVFTWQTIHVGNNGTRFAPSKFRS